MTVTEVKLIGNINTYVLDKMLDHSDSSEWGYLYPGVDVSDSFVRRIKLIELVQRSLSTYMELNGYPEFIETYVNPLISKSRMNGTEALYHMYKSCAYLLRMLSPIHIKQSADSRRVTFESYEVYAVKQYWVELSK